MKKLLLSCLVSMSIGAFAQVGPPQATNPNTNNGYGFEQSSGTYTPLSAARTIWQSGAALGTDAVSAAINLPSVFKYNGKSYSSIYISNNGFVTLGTPALAATYSGLSTDTSTPYEGAFAGFAVNLRNANTTTSEISYETVVSKFVVQFTDLQGNSAAAAQIINFQIQFDLTSNTVNIVYGNCVSGTATLAGQVGIRGSESSDTNNRTGTDWTATAIGTSTSSSCTLGTTNGVTVPTSGLTFTFTPGTWLSTAPTYATLPFTESFGSWTNGNSTGDLPNAVNWRTWPSRGDNSWRASDNSVSGFSSASGWSSVNGNAAIAAPAVAPTARFHAYNTVNASGYMDLYIDLSTGAGSRILNFDYINPTGSDNLKIQVSTDAGTTFNTVGSTYGVSSSWSTKYVDLGTNSATAVVRFLATGDNGSDDIYIDNVNINAVTCAMPDIVTVGTTTATTESVSWTITTPAPSYDIYYSTTNTAPTSGSTPNVIGATGTTYTLTGLAPLTTYYVWVRSRCSGTDQGIWIAGPSFTTKTFCPVVTAPTSSATGVSVTPTFTWTANTDATGYRISIGTTSGGTDVLNNTDVGNVTTYTLPAALNNSTTYYYTINSYNAGVTSTSCTVRNFTTVCNSTNVPYTLDFENVTTPALPACTSVVNSGSGNSWKTTTAPTGFTGKVLNYSYNSSNAANTWFFTQGINLTAGVSYRIKYKYANSSGTTQYPEKVKVAYGSSAASAAMANTLADHSNIITNGVPTNTFTDFTPATTGVYYFGFQAYSAANMNQIYVDDININITPTCTEPSAVAVSAITTTGASVSWTAPATAPGSGYEYYYSTSNTAPTASTTASGVSTTTSAPLSGLNPSTTYYLWVRSVCSTSDKSAWTSTAVTFNTLCGTVMAPFSQNFDSGTAPTCWSNVNSTATTTDVTLFWKFSGNADYGASPINNGKAAGTYAWVDASSPYTGAGTHTVELVTPSINLTGLTAPFISFDWFKNHSTTATTTVTPSTYDNNKLIVEVNDGNGWVSVFSDTTNSNQWRTVGIPLAASYVGATIQVRFTVDKNVNGNGYYFDDLLLDNIEVKQNTNLATSEVSGAKNEIKAYPNPFADVLNISDISKVKSVSVVDLAGRVVKTIDNPSSALQLGDLKQGMYLVILNMKDGSKQTIKAIKK
ncbi:fibronectin type III domain-containing protein [Chryseobacterium sp. NFX27]|uniref:fibronectin type III domain-containing protein n=1 Tax=Chryseobacterium sp. NFX27 TaxID=2819618 RepID=UPI003CF7C10D